MSVSPRRFVGQIALFAALSLVAVGLPATTAQAASGDVTFVGHGWGHGRGMGQYGALGYAVNYGWSSAQILDHFYGGTAAGTVGNLEMTVELTGLTGRDTIVIGNGLAINGAPASAAAVLVSRTASGAFQAYGAPGCGGPWVATGGSLGSGLRISASGDQGVLGNVVRVCDATGERAYRGSLSVVDQGGTQMTINYLPTESYLRGVVPRESPASWADLGGGRGMQALMAQSVAARSYALSSTRSSGAHTCDTTACQVYGGAGYKQGSVWTVLEDSRADAAIGATAGMVRLKNGVPARTEFSSSTGGYTAGGTFPAVVDAGDSVVYNPNHSWATTLALSVVASRLGTGAIRTMAVTARNGLGADGGRVTTVRVVSTAGVVRDFAGDQVRLALGLKSNWFSISSYTPAEAESIVNALYADLLLRPVEPTGLGTWSAFLAGGGSQAALVASLTSSDEYVQLRIRQAYEEVLGRAPEAAGMANWRREILAGRATVDDVKRRFYDSQEYYNRSGGTPEGYIDLLYHTAFERPASASEIAYWSGRMSVVGRSAVVDGIWYSMEAAMYRSGNYYRVFLKREPDWAGQVYWARVLLSKGEGAVRIGIAGSEEYRLLASVRFP